MDILETSIHVPVLAIMRRETLYITPPNQQEHIMPINSQVQYPPCPPCQPTRFWRETEKA